MIIADYLKPASHLLWQHRKTLNLEKTLCCFASIAHLDDYTWGPKNILAALSPGYPNRNWLHSVLCTDYVHGQTLSVPNSNQSEQGTRKRRQAQLTQWTSVRWANSALLTSIPWPMVQQRGKSMFYPFTPLLLLLPFFSHLKLKHLLILGHVLEWQERQIF